MSKSQTHFIGTDARVILSQWQALAELIAKHSQRVKERLESDEPLENELEDAAAFTLLNQQEVEDALSGPFSNFFKCKMTAYSKITRVRLELAIKENELFKDKRQPPVEAKPIPEKILKNTSLDALSKLQSSLDKQTKEHDQQWEELLMQANELVLKGFDSMGISLSILEISEFQTEEPMSELMSRIIEQRIDLPKYDADHVMFKDYFTFKAYVIIQSALAREHKPHTTADIKREFKALKPVINDIAKQEKELAKNQTQATQELIAAIDF